jgi:hypothetical protein
MVPSPSRHRRGDDLRQPAGVTDRTGGDDGVGDAASEALLAEAADDAGEFGLADLVDEVRGVVPGIRAHAHVERAGASVGEASLPHVELVRRDTEVENGAIEFIESLLQDRFQFLKVDAVQRHPHQALRFRGCVRVAIQSDHPQAGDGCQQGAGMPAPSEGRIEDHAGLHRGERRHQRFHQHGDVIGGVGPAHGQPPGALAPKWKRAEYGAFHMASRGLTMSRSTFRFLPR